MKRIKAFFQKLRLGNAKIGRQIYAIYVLALLIPLSVLGILLLTSGSRLLSSHSIELLEADNSRVKTLLSEVTTQAYTIAEDICFDSSLKQLLTRAYTDYSDFIEQTNGYRELDDLIYTNQELDKIYIYSSNPTMKNYKQFRNVTPQIAEADWYREALGSSGALWLSIPEESYTDNLSNLCLVRRIVLPESEYQAVVVIRISDSYIRSRIDSGSVTDAISVDGQGIVYSSRRGWYGQPQPVSIDQSQAYFRYSGKAQVEGTDCYTAVSTLHLYKTNCKMYICTLDSSGPSSTRGIVTNWVVLLLVALVVPGVILALFTLYFSRRVGLLREEMHKASSQDYNILASFSGNDELTEAFEDLKLMVRDIKAKDAKMYEAELKEQELRNNQQAMEYKMLASQINPHYLYNTLETIRMKALTSGSREVADSVKILGKTLHYVQENTGTAFTTLRKELEHVENYLAIQKLRFGDRINYTQTIQPGLDTESYTMLPLLLQPLVENAVVHGLEAVEGTGIIALDVSSKGSLLQITVRDNGRGMTGEELDAVRQMLCAPEPDPKASVALYNIHRRIGLCYGKEYGIHLDSQPGLGTAVTLNLPANSTKISF